MSSAQNDSDKRRQLSCHHCGRPPIQSYGTDDGGALLLCLDCALKYETIQREQWRRNTELLNFTLSQFGMMTGIEVPRFQTQPPPMHLSAGNTLNSIHVTNSNVGVLNTGHIRTIDSAIGFLSSGGGVEVAAAIKALTEAVANSTEATKAQKNELIELLSLIATEATVPTDKRKSKGIRPIISQTASMLSGLNALSSLWTKYGTVISSFFGLS